MKSAPIGVGILAIILEVLVAIPAAGQSPQGEESPARAGDPSAAASNESSPQARSGPPSDYVIGPEDLIGIEVFGVPELTKTVRVAYDGTVMLPGLGRVPVSGYTPDELGKELERRWGENYLQNPQVSIFVQEFHSQPVSVIGAVEKPGVYELKGRRTLVEMLSMAGGLSKMGSAPGRWIYLTRRGGFDKDFAVVDGMQRVGPDKVEIDLRKLLFSRAEGLDLSIHPFDTISVSVADVIYVAGDVKKPGGFALDEHETLTVLQALALAEGPNATAARKRARIIRRKSDGSYQEIPLDLGKLMGGKSNDPELAANDILFVPSSTGKSAAKKSADSVIATLSGMLIFGRL